MFHFLRGVSTQSGLCESVLIDGGQQERGFGGWEGMNRSLEPYTSGALM